MKTLKTWSYLGTKNNQVDLEVEGKHLFSIFVLEDKVVRILLQKHKALRHDRTWSITPAGRDVPWEGRSRLSTEGFSLPNFELLAHTNKLVITTGELRLTITEPLQLHWEAKTAAGDWQQIAQDRPTGAYMLALQDHRHSHFLQRFSGDLYYGLGEKAGDLQRNGRRFEMRNLDAMGYDAQTTDPLYKHLPFTLTRTASGISYGLFYDNLATCWFELGNELDNYHKPYRAYRTEDGDLDYYFTLGPSLHEVTKRQVWLTGKTAFPPKWSIGYSGSTMHYTDADNAQEQLEGFIDLVQSNAIPCDSFQLSSGYTSIGDKRYVFNWNYDKVPTPDQMTGKFQKAGINLAANIKPCLLQDHPRYSECADKELFIKDSETGMPERSLYWDDEGSHLDFTNPDTITWWKENVTKELLMRGIGSTWNDNNEYEIWDSAAKCRGFGQPIDISLIRPLHSLLMMRASEEAQVEYAPEERPYLISRCGSPGFQRHVQTWTGDNRTGWNNLKYNIKMGLGLSMSGIYNVGHDVGGFSGNRPDPELFVRWVQNGVMHPRFTIHSWNDDHTVNEPWMYPAVTPLIRNAMRLRQQLLPYFYTLLWRAHVHDEPMIRPTFMDHEHDPNTFAECDDFMLGRDILVASVVEQGQRQRHVYLPDNHHGWYEFDTGTYHAGGQTILTDAPLERLPLFVRAGAVLPMANPCAYNTTDSKLERLVVYPFQGTGVNESYCFEDDGRSHKWQQGDHLTLTMQLVGSASGNALTITRQGKWDVADASLVVEVAGKNPNGIAAPLSVNGTLAGAAPFSCSLQDI
ncbi:TIM-barrel domain-containing protein [Polycladidibacter hongkongensis]|uniref:glycoside hydrolase family 31 protein n=1 Tax=Polycladidibacter hongkongensis TaxID=1647556 RepID=UPI0008367D3E|nr:glycoside hydrolase family 31 protein [Pseudovibrio hongkongensis]